MGLAMNAGRLDMGFALMRTLIYALGAYEAAEFIRELFPPIDGPRKKCHCMCVKPNPLPGRGNILDGPFSWLTDEDDCKRYPLTDEGRRERYTYCYCR